MTGSGGGGVRCCRSPVRVHGDVADAVVGPGIVGEDLRLEIEHVVVRQLIERLGKVALVELPPELTETVKKRERERVRLSQTLFKQVGRRAQGLLDGLDEDDVGEGLGDAFDRGRCRRGLGGRDVRRILDGHAASAFCARERKRDESNRVEV